MTRFSRSLVVFALLLGIVHPAAAQQADPPKVTTALSSVDELIKDLEYLLKLTNPQEQKQWDVVNENIQIFLGGIDTTKPVRIDILLGGEVEQYRPSFPISDLNQFLQNVAAFGIANKKIGANFYSLNGGGFAGFLRIGNGYGSIAEQKNQIPATLKDPQAAIKDLTGQYDLAGDIQNDVAGQASRRKAITTVRKNLIDAVTQKKDEDDDDFALRKLALVHQLDEMERFFVEASRISVGWSTDVDKHEGRANVHLAAIAKTDLEAAIGLLGQKPSRFAAIPQDKQALIFGRINHPLGELRQGHLLEFFKHLRPVTEKKIDADADLNDEEKTNSKQVSDLIIGILENGAKSGELDGFIEMVPDEGGTHTAVGALVVTDGNAALPILELLPKANSKVQVEMDVAEADGVKIHSISIPAKDQEKFAAYFGKSHKIYVGVGETILWTAAGDKAVERMKAAIQHTAGEAPETAKSTVAELFVKLGPLLKILDQERGEEGKAATRKMAIEAFADGDDTITMKLEKVEDHVEGQTTMGKGILKFVGKMIADFSAENLQ